MTTFRFNFYSEDDGSNNELADNKNKSIQWLASEQIIPENQLKDIDEKVSRARMFTCGDVEIGHVAVSEALTNIEESVFKNAVELAEKERSDLVTGVYEGGLKIWECTFDLVEYLESLTDMDFQDKKVLDLGCGAGILGIYAFLKGSYVTFQDYNKEVLEHVTITNVLLNIEEEDEREDEIKQCQFYSGDWASFNNKLKDNDVFDIILTSETIYNECNYKKLILLFLQRLSTDGVLFVAAKTYYFGVGGGISQFEQLIKDNGKLRSEVCWASKGGIQREILKITHNK